MKTIQKSSQKQEPMSKEDRSMWVLYGAFWGIIALLCLFFVMHVWQSLFSPQSIKVSTVEAIGTAFIFAIPCGAFAGGYVGYLLAPMPKDERKVYLIGISCIVLLLGLFRFVLNFFMTEPKSGEISFSALLWNIGPVVATTWLSTYVILCGRKRK